MRLHGTPEEDESRSVGEVRLPCPYPPHLSVRVEARHADHSFADASYQPPAGDARRGDSDTEDVPGGVPRDGKHLL